MDWKKVWKASKWPIIIGFLFNLLMLGVSLAISLILEATTDSHWLLYLVVFILPSLSFLISMAIYVYGAYRAAKKFQATALEGGAVAVSAFAMVHTVTTILSTLASLFMAASTFSDMEGEAVALSLGMLGAMTVFGAIFSYLGLLVAGVGICMIFGIGVAYWVSRKWW